MHIGRTIFAVLVSLSVVMLPMTGGAVSSPQLVDVSASAAAHDCCPPEGPPCDKAIGGCTSMAMCGLSSFSATNASFSDLIFPLISSNAVLPVASSVLLSQTGSPPLRPPQV